MYIFTKKERISNNLLLYQVFLEVKLVSGVNFLMSVNKVHLNSRKF